MIKKIFKIGKREIGPGQPVFIVAEMSGNHNQSFKRAKELVEAACDAGVDAIKLQTYTADTLTIDSSEKWFQVKVNESWKGKSLYELYQEAYTPWAWQPKLKEIAEKRGVLLFSTPFDETAVDFLDKMKVPVYKVASFEIGDLELLKKIASKKKPVILSRGMASLEEIRLALSTLKKNGASDIALLHCVSSYPARIEDMNLATINDMRKRFGVVSGLSDHSLGISAAIAAVVLGASIIEKHFTLRRVDGGPDASFSLEPKELKQLVIAIREVEKAIGRIQYGAGKKESENIVFRRSLFAVEDIEANELFTRKNIRCIRPGYGLAPKLLPRVLGKKAKEKIKKGTPLKWNLIKN
ncbi:MAG: pseudaminic acid synthase [bacterium]